MFNPKLVMLLCAVILVSGCGKKDDAAATSGFSADKPSAIMGAVATGVAKVGGGMSGSSSSLKSSRSSLSNGRLSAADCSEHGEPITPTNRADSAYAGKLTYCKVTTDTGDEESVQGVFSGIKDIACMVEHAAPTYDGVAHNVTLTFDSNCFTAEKLAHMDGIASGTTVTASVIASSPAAFNTHYDKGVDITVSIGGSNHHYAFGTKVTGNVIEVTYFDEDKDQPNKTGSGAGYLDLDKGILRVESRMDRIGCSQNSSCGWNRHIRLYATLTMDGTTVKDPKEVDFLYANVSSALHGAQSAYDGYLITASGNLTTTGIKPRGFVTGSRASDAQVNTLTNWTENASNGDCFTNSTDKATTCGTGLDKMSTNMKFVMSVGSGYTLPYAWFTTEPGLSFTSVSADDDTP